MVFKVVKYVTFCFQLIISHNVLSNTLHQIENSTLTQTSSKIQNLTFPIKFNSTINSTITNSSNLISIPLKNMNKILRTGFFQDNPDVYCKYQPNGFDCDKSDTLIPKFYYDLKMENCRTFYYGQCEMNLNRFNTLTQCHNTCMEAGVREITGNFSPEIYCNFQPDFGKCNDYHPMWYYDVTTRSCKGFSYSGCGGNINRFRTSQQCAETCTFGFID